MGDKEYKRNLSSVGFCLFVVVVGLDNKEKLDSRLQSGRLLGKEQVRKKHRMKGAQLRASKTCVCMLILASRRWGFTEGGRVCERAHGW